MKSSSSFRRMVPPSLMGILLIGTTMIMMMSTFVSKVESKAILGVDLGSLYMKVALVRRNSPLEIVTNLHSKRKTEQMILFDNGARFYGADASSLLARKPHLTPSAMTLMLGRHDTHPTVQVLAERHYPIRPEFNTTRSGVCLNIDGMVFTPEELVAMVLTHAKDISAIYGDIDNVDTVRDCVLTVPSFYTVHERRALLDAAELADLNVLSLIDETTAAALHYGMDRIEKEPTRVLFYNMGASALQVEVVEFFSYEHKESKYSKSGKVVGAFEVKGKAWDTTLGGDTFDSRLVNYMADKFNDVWNTKRNDGQIKDVRDNKRAMTKLKIQANKVKHVLSANTDIPVFIEALHDDTNLNLSITRSEFEQLCHDLLVRASEPILGAIKAANMTLDDINSVELIGGGMRIPRVQEEIQKTLGDKLELGLHINSDESMALGAAFHGANISTAFRVRHVGMADVNPFAVDISLSHLDGGASVAAAAEGNNDEGPWHKQATLFKSFGKVGIKKIIAFSQDQEVHCELNYDKNNDILPDGTETSIAKYNITGISEFAKEMVEKGLGKPKVSLQFELSTSGITELIRAEATVEETYTVNEEVEVEVDADDDEEGATTEENEQGSETKEAKEEEKASDDEEVKKEGSGDETKKEENDKKPKKKKIKKTVEKEKKKTHKRTLTVSKYYTGRVQPYSDDVRETSKAKLYDLAEKDKARIMLEEAKNTFESFIYYVKNKLIDDEEELKKISTDEQRESLREMAMEANDWLDFDGWDADLETYQTKLAELSAPANEMFHRLKEYTKRPEAIAEARKKLSKVEDLMNQWITTMPQVTEEERSDVLGKVEDIRKWLSDKEDAQAALNPWDPVAFNSTDVPKQSKSLEKLVTKLSKKPKPKPPVVPKNDTNNDDDKDKAENETVSEEDTGDDTTSEKKDDEGTKVDTEEGEEL